MKSIGLRLTRAAVLGACLVSTFVHSASFDCNKAKTATEKLICSSPEISSLDDELSSAYQKARSLTQQKDALRRWQHEWLTSREYLACVHIECLKAQYHSRISLLKSVAEPATKFGKASGHYIRYFNGRPDRDTSDFYLIGLDDGRVHISGFSIWLGPNAKMGQINTGEMQGMGKIRGNIIQFDSDECSASIKLTVKGMQITDESGCGGLNVTFNGDYLKQ